MEIYFFKFEGKQYYFSIIDGGIVDFEEETYCFLKNRYPNSNISKADVVVFSDGISCLLFDSKDDKVDLFVIYDHPDGKKSLDPIPEKKIEDGEYVYCIHNEGVDSLGNHGPSGWTDHEIVIKDGRYNEGRAELLGKDKFFIPKESDEMMVAYKLN